MPTPIEEIVLVRNPTKDENYNMLRQAVNGLVSVETVFEPGIDLRQHIKRDRRGRVVTMFMFSGGGQKGTEAFDLFEGEPLYKPQMELVKDPEVPTVGICLGDQIGNIALGGKIGTLPRPYRGQKEIKFSAAGSPGTADQEADHDYYKSVVSPELEVVAWSETGPEISIAPQHQFTGIAFHPERPGDYHLMEYLEMFGPQRWAA